MRAWESVTVPSLARFGAAPDVAVHDSATSARMVSAPDGPARLYVCGITPYDATHLGHAATYLAFDLLVRAWRDTGRDVHYVQNVTDVDDPLLERAEQTGEDWRHLAEREIERFRGDMEALRILPPREYVGAVEAMPVIVELIERLLEEGHAYRVEEDLYFPVRADPSFGSVSGLDAAEMAAVFAERGGDPDRPGKQDPLDCLLWQAERPGEPAWDSPLGRGRPGWHVECSAIALSLLGECFDVQGGGSDLAFPHHEMSAAEVQALRGGGHYARAYVHAGMVGYEGEKMSKSRGNLVFVSELRRAGVDPVLIRTALLAHHYRSDWEWTDQELPAAEKRLAAWRSALPHTGAEEAERLLARVRAALADDLDAPAALRLLDDWADRAPGVQGDHGARAAQPGGTDPRAAEVVRDLVDARLGVLL